MPDTSDDTSEAHPALEAFWDMAFDMIGERKANREAEDASQAEDVTPEETL